LLKGLCEKFWVSVLEQIREDPFSINGLKMISEEAKDELIKLAKERKLPLAGFSRYMDLSRTQMNYLQAKKVFSMNREQWALYEKLLVLLKKKGSKIELPPVQDRPGGNEGHDWEVERKSVLVDPALIPSTDQSPWGWGGVRSSSGMRWVSCMGPRLSDEENGNDYQ